MRRDGRNEPHIDSTDPHIRCAYSVSFGYFLFRYVCHSSCFFKPHQHIIPTQASTILRRSLRSLQPRRWDGSATPVCECQARAPVASDALCRGPALQLSSLLQEPNEKLNTSVTAVSGYISARPSMHHPSHMTTRAPYIDTCFLLAVVGFCQVIVPLVRSVRSARWVWSVYERLTLCIQIM